jgi:hypothetical protein
MRRGDTVKWPFKRKREATDLRVFRDPKSGELTLRMDGSVGWPSAWEEPIVQLQVRLTTPMTESVARQIRDQLNAFLPGE